MIRQGVIVWATVYDPRGGNPKKRPVIVLTADREIRDDGVFVGIVCSNSAANVVPRPDHYIEIPFQRDGACRTRLRKPTVAIVGWYAEVPVSSVPREDVGGVVPPLLLESIVRAVIADRDRR